MATRNYRTSTPEGTRAVTIRLSQHVYDAAKTTAKAEGLSMALLIENAVSSYVVSNRTTTYGALTSSASSFADTANSLVNEITTYQSALNALSGKPEGDS